MTKQHLVQGTVKRHPDGFGFLIPDDPNHDDVYLPRHTMDGVMTSDTVLVKVKDEGNDRYSGTVERIVNRAHKVVVGVFNGGYVHDTSHAWGANLRIARTGREVLVNNGDLVAIKILNYPDSVHGFTGEIVENLGNAHNPLLDTKRILYENNVPMEFSKEALSELKGIEEEPTEKDFHGRKDLRNLKFVTIDGATARDFDDAVYAETTSGGFQVWVAIADVSHYVQINTALDRDAYERGTSVYFPDMVVPMLPEKLSNGLCSLNPHKSRLVMVAEMKLNHQGEIVHSEFYNGIIKSHHRMTYGAVQEIIDGKEVSEFEDVRPNISLMADIAKILMRKRFSEGSLDLELPEVELLIDESGNPVDILRSERLFSHRLIEEFMLLANVAVARFISQKEFPCLYRVHEDPNEMSLKSLSLMAHNWGLGFTFRPGKMLQKQIMRLLEKAKGKPFEQVLHMLVLRSLKQAKYSHDPMGHFGLAFGDYLHFTSPIRRYPDLVVHRQLKRLIKKEHIHPKNEESELAKMASMGTFLSACEQRANRAERDLASTKRCRFLVQKVGETFEGMVSGVAKFGFFVQLRVFDVDGLVKLDRLDFDRFEFDGESHRLVGRRTGKVISIGDQVTVQVAKVDVGARQIDFELITDEGQNAHSHNRKANREDHQERGKAPAHSGRFREAWAGKRRGGPGKGRPVHSKKNNKKKRNRKSHGR